MHDEKKGPNAAGPCPESDITQYTKNIIPKIFNVKRGRCNGCFFLFPIEELVMDPERGLLCDDCRAGGLSPVAFGKEEGLCIARI